MTKPLVSIVMGSDSDLEIMREAGKALDEFGIAYEMDVTSAHRSPDRTADFARKAAERGIRVIIAGAGGAAHLAGVIAAHTTLPVIGVPIPSRHGFAAGDGADAGGNSGGHGRDWKTGSDQRGNSCGPDDWVGRCLDREETASSQREAGAGCGGEIEEAEGGISSCFWSLLDVARFASLDSRRRLSLHGFRRLSPHDSRRLFPHECKKDSGT